MSRDTSDQLAQYWRLFDPDLARQRLDQLLPLAAAMELEQLRQRTRGEFLPDVDRELFSLIRAIIRFSEAQIAAASRAVPE